MATHPDNERAPLLQPSNSHQGLGTSSAILPTPPGSDPEQQSYGAFLRRHSSSHQPPYHLRHLPADGTAPSSTAAIYTVVPISLLGVFVANADGSLVVASSQQIASEFNTLSNASWLVTAFVLAQCASQPLYGKLSDIFGRKSNLTVSYLLFAAGCFLCGVGRTYGQVLAGRAISGLGGAGMTALVSIIIADMVPVREVASWRSYVNVAATVGRGMGGPVGGWLCDTIGWRWCFYWQVPFTVVGLGLILWKLPTHKGKAVIEDEEETFRAKLRRVDFLGALALMVAITGFLLSLDGLSKQRSKPLVITTTATFLGATLTFVLVEAYWTTEPIIPLRLIANRATITAYLIAGLQIAAQFSVFYSVPIYFQVASGSTAADAGLRLAPAVVGNATAGLICGYVIARTGRYKYLTMAGALIGCVGYTLMMLFWHGNTSWPETLYIFFGGFASGTAQSNTFIHLAASLDERDIAIAGTNLYLVQSLFLLVGIQGSTALLSAQMRFDLEKHLAGYPHKDEIIADALSDVRSIRKLPEQIYRIVVRAYRNGLSLTFSSALWTAFLSFLVACTLRERRL